jgi:hypothetical protein
MFSQLAIVKPDIVRSKDHMHEGRNPVTNDPTRPGHKCRSVVAVTLVTRDSFPPLSLKHNIQGEKEIRYDSEIAIKCQ